MVLAEGVSPELLEAIFSRLYVELELNDRRCSLRELGGFTGSVVRILEEVSPVEVGNIELVPEAMELDVGLLGPRVVLDEKGFLRETIVTLAGFEGT